MMSSGDVFSAPNSSSAKQFPQEVLETNPNPKSNSNPNARRKRNLPGTPDPDAEVIALSPKTLMTKNRFLCEICNKGFQRDQNLQLHRRGHNLPWKLKQRANKDQIKKKVYICPEKTCVHHDPARALGDLTGVKKHFSRKHGEKKWKCEKCSKKYAVQSDWKAHSKTCGTREYKCDCGTLFSRRDSFITHRAFCDALAEESARNITTVGSNNLNFKNDLNPNLIMNPQSNNLTQRFTNPGFGPDFGPGNSIFGDPNQKPRLSLWLEHQNTNSQHFNPMDNSNLYMTSNNISQGFPDHMMQMSSNNVFNGSSTISLSPLKDERKASSFAPMSATSLLQKAAQMGSTKSNPSFFNSPSSSLSANILSFNNPSTRDFLGMASENGPGPGPGPFFQQELAKFASMSNSNMGMSHFSGNQ